MINFKEPCESFEQACFELVELAVSPVKAGGGLEQRHKPEYFGGYAPIHKRWVPYMFPEDTWLLNWSHPDNTDELVSMATNGGKINESWACSIAEDDDVPAFARVRTVNASSVRSCIWPIPATSRFLVEVAVGMFMGESSRSVFGSSSTYVTAHNGKLVDVSRNQGRFRQDGRGNGPGLTFGSVSKDVASNIAIASSLQFSMRYEWRVKLGYKNCVGPAMVVDRNGLKEIFKTRDRDKGRNRRSALLNIVASHWKRGRGQEPAEDPKIFVREHLRGQKSFCWNGIDCEVVVPAFDAERLTSAARP